MNIFAGLDNSQMMNFQDLKRSTFRDIFSCKNEKARSIKKPLNFLNYSNERSDIITKKERNPAYEEFNKQLLEYEAMKPPEYDLQANLAASKKRQKGSLERQSRKHIVKNIKTCTAVAKSYRERVKKSVTLKSTGLFTKNGHFGELSPKRFEKKAARYANFLDGFA